VTLFISPIFTDILTKVTYFFSVISKTVASMTEQTPRVKRVLSEFDELKLHFQIAKDKAGIISFHSIKHMLQIVCTRICCCWHFI